MNNLTSHNFLLQKTSLHCAISLLNSSILFFLLFGIACNQNSNSPDLDKTLPPSNKDSPVDKTEQKPEAAKAPFSIGKYIPIDSVVAPEITPLHGAPKINSAYPNRFPAGQPIVVPLPEKLTVITPGKDGVPVPKVVPAKSKVVLAGQPKPVPARPLQYKDGAPLDIQYLDIDMGLKADGVLSILQDSRSHFWFGTPAGAIRYDGKNLQMFGENEGLLPGAVTSIIEDRQGRLWFATFGGVTCYDGKNFLQYTIDGRPPSAIIIRVLEDTKGNIWIADTNGLICFDGSNFTIYTEKEGLIMNRVFSIFQDSMENLWIGTMGGGVCRFDGESFTHFTAKEGLSANLVYTIMEDNAGNIWFGTNNGVSKFDGKSFSNLTVKEGLMGTLALSVAQDQFGRIWIGGRDMGARSKSALSCYDGKTWTRFTDQEGLSSNTVRILYPDKQGIIWAGTGKGPCRINLDGIQSYSKHNGLEYEQMISGIQEDKKGDLWLGTWAGGLVRFDGNQFTHFKKGEGLKGDIVNRIFLDKTGDLWFDIGMIGETRFDGKTLKYFSRENQPYIQQLMLIDREGRLWFEGDRSVLVSDGNGYKTFSILDSLGTRPLKYIIQDSRGNIWFGTWEHGLIRFDGKTFTQFTEADGLCSNFVNVIFEDSRRNIWVGTEGSGLSCYDGTRFVNYHQKDGLGSDWIYTINEDKRGYLWVTSYYGVSLFVKKADNVPSNQATETDKPYTIYSFDERDGVRGKNIQGNYLDGKNNLCLGSEKGLMKLNLDRFNLPTQAPKLQLTHIEVSQQFVDYQKIGDTAYQREFPIAKQIGSSAQSVVPFSNLPTALSVPYAHNHLTFHFSATDWTAPHKIRYSYYIERIEKDWSVPQSEAFADYRNLPIGTYTLKVKAMGSAMIWSDPVTYTFTIRAPWYRSNLAYLAYILIFGYIVFALRRYELNRQSVKAEAKRLQELDQVKTRLYTNISHEFRTPLTVIIGLAEQMKSQVAGQAEAGLDMIHRNGRQVLHLVNQMLELSKLESGSLPLNTIQGDIVLYLKYLLESFHSLADSKQIALHFTSDVKEYWMDFDPDKLQKIATNLLSNAVKFTPVGGDVTLAIAVSDGDTPHVALNVSDTGPGISEESLPYIFDRFYQADDSNSRKAEGTGIGLALTKELVKLLGGTITVENLPEAGARFRVMLPVRRNAEKDTTIQDVPIQETGADSANAYARKTVTVDAEKPTLLIIEDNPDVGAYLSRLLAEDYSIEIATIGRQGLDKALAHIPDLIISDVMMPEMDGFEVCHLLKTDKRSSHIPIVLLTAKADIDSRIEGLGLGADAYLAKPFEERELRVQLRKLLELRRALRERYAGFGLPTPSDDPAFQREDAFFKELYAVLENNFSDPDFGVPELCKAVAMSRSSLYRKLTSLAGKNVEDFLRTFRLQKAYSLLKTTDRLVQNVAWDCGFKDPAHFTRSFQEEFGILPSVLQS